MPGKQNYKDNIHAKGTDIAVISSGDENDYISLTDIARYKSDDPTATIQNWMRTRDVIEFLGLWEQLNNPEFKPLEFEGFRNAAGANAFTIWGITESQICRGSSLARTKKILDYSLCIFCTNLPNMSLHKSEDSDYRITVLVIFD